MRISRFKVKELLARYDSSLVLGRLIGSGGMSDVYDLPGTKPAQVLKVMDTNCACNRDSDYPEDIERRRRMREYFLNEIWAMKQLRDCKYTVSLLKAGEISLEKSEKNTFRSVFFVQMNKLETLSDYLNRTESTEKTMVQLARDICHALNACREKSILHRDVKPSNIFVAVDEEGPYFVLGDFGISRRMHNYTGFVSICGTPEFTAPEIMNHMKISPQLEYSSDVYSLGSTLYYELSGGRYPGIYFRKGKNRLEKLAGVSEAFLEIILKSVQYYPQNRYKDSEALYEQLEKLVPEEDRKIIDNPHFLGAKEAMLVDDYKLAIQYAEAGCRVNEAGCQRLYAYCLYHENKDKADKADIVAKVTEILDLLTYEGDSIAQCIRAIIHWEYEEYAEFLENILESAEEKCTLAQYLCGRLLYYGDKRFPDVRDREKGLMMLIESAQENYLPSIRILKRIKKTDRCAVLPEELMPVIDLFDEEGPYNSKPSTIRCL